MKRFLAGNKEKENDYKRIIWKTIYYKDNNLCDEFNIEDIKQGLNSVVNT